MKALALPERVLPLGTYVVVKPIEALQAQRRHLPGDLKGIHHLAHDGFHLPGAGMATQLPDFLLHKGERRPPGQQPVVAMMWDENPTEQRGIVSMSQPTSHNLLRKP